MSPIKIRQHGFNTCIDNEEMFLELVGEILWRRILPA